VNKLMNSEQAHLKAVNKSRHKLPPTPPVPVIPSATETCIAEQKPAKGGTRRPVIAETPLSGSVDTSLSGSTAHSVTPEVPVERPESVSASVSWRRSMQRAVRNTDGLMVSGLALITGLAIWHWATAANLDLYINFENVPSPFTVFSAFVEHLQTEAFYVHIAVSMRRILISYCLAAVIGIVIGLLMGRSRLVRAFFMPYIEIVRPIPAVAWIPLAILMWPTEEASIIYITYLGALFPIVINTMHGVEQTPEVLVRAARSLGASSINIFWHIVLPAAFPSIAAGLAIGMGVSWFSLQAGESIAGQYGIGFFRWNAYSLINYQDIVVGMLVIGFLGTFSTLAVRSITRPFLRWQDKTR